MITLTIEMIEILKNEAVKKMAEVNGTSEEIVEKALKLNVPNACIQFEKLWKAGINAINDIARTLKPSNKINPRYLAFTLEYHHRKNYIYVTFIDRMVGLYANSFGQDSTPNNPFCIIDHDDFTAFIEENAHLAGEIQ